MGLLLLLLVSAAPPPVDFQRDVAPLLARRCLECHSGADPRGKLDLSRKVTAMEAIVPFKPGASVLYRKARDGKMPPKQPLPAEEREMLRRWIAEGAKWDGPIDPFRVTTSTRAGYDWWSLQPVRRPVPLAVKDARWARNPIDLFVLARLEKAGLKPSPQAGRRTLLRRLSFGLTGLPPAPEDVREFIAHSGPGAYERAAARLLASPAFGERWARHWLDVARYGESDGFERDLPRFNAWPYRDWLVRAFNEDVPYDEFARTQLAGDVLKPGDPAALAATGFLVAGPHDIVVPSADAMKQAMRQDELEDIVGTTAQTFLGLTFHCARCHDHKFDPVHQADYYRLVSALSGVGHGEHTVPVRSRQLARVRAKQEKLRRELEALEEPARKAILARGDRLTAPRPLATWDFTRGPDDAIAGLKGELKGGAKRDAAGLHLDGKGAHLATAPLPFALGAKTLQAWVRLANTAQRGGGVVTVQTLNGNLFDAIVFGEQHPGRWMPGSDFFRRTRSLNGPEEKSTALVHIAITYAADGTITAYRDGKPYGRPYRTTVQPFEAGKSQLVFGMRHGPPGGNKMLAGTVVRAMLHGRALSAAEVAACSGLPVVLRADILARLAPEQRKKHGRLSAELSALQAEEARLAKGAGRKMYATRSLPAGVSRLLRRGDVRLPGDVVAAEVPTALARYLGATRLKPDAPEGERRKALAAWITSPKNPLFARVIVNRLWHHHFGVGLVDTPSDFGFNGGRPSHPELLDWLAAELIDSGWSLKHIHRLIVTSAAYRQSSRATPEGLAKDANNRLLWRRSPSRLEAEALRDAMLSVAGSLTREMGGPPDLDFKTYFFKGTQFYDPLDARVPARRSLYRMWARGGRSPFLDTFDCPDPSATTPRRQATTTPLQALALLNNALVFRLADDMAERVKREAGEDVSSQVRRTFQLSYQRLPSPREERLVVPFAKKHGLPALCRVLFNSGEFSQVE